MTKHHLLHPSVVEELARLVVEGEPSALDFRLPVIARLAVDMQLGVVFRTTGGELCDASVGKFSLPFSQHVTFRHEQLSVGPLYKHVGIPKIYFTNSFFFKKYKTKKKALRVTVKQFPSLLLYLLQARIQMKTSPRRHVARNDDAVRFGCAGELWPGPDNDQVELFTQMCEVTKN
jgi:hypothetical protein